MKKKLILMLISCLTLSLVACGDKENNISDTSTEKEMISTENVDETELDEVEIKGIVYDVDLSAFGEMVNTFFVISNEHSNFKTKEEFLTYTKEKNYNFYKYTNSDLDKNIMTDEEVSKKYELAMKPDFILNESGNPKYAFALVGFDKSDKLKVIQYKYKEVSEDFVINQRTNINTLIDSGVFNQENIVVKYNNDKDTWTQLYINFYDEKSDLFGYITVTLDTYETFMNFWMN